MRSIKVVLFIVFAAWSIAASAENVAVLVYAQDKGAKRFESRAMSHFETILFDNGYEVLDQEQAAELKDVWKQLEDPSYFVTAEDIVANAEKYRIDGIFRLFLNVDTYPGLADYFSATANVDLRFIDGDAKVTAAVSPVMGGKGNPPSDGLSASSAGLNAVQRAVDKASAEYGLELLEVKSPRLVDLVLQPAAAPSAEYQTVGKRNLPGQASSIAPLVAEKWTTGEATCSAQSEDRSMGIVGEYITSSDQQLAGGPRSFNRRGFGGGPRTSSMTRVYGSKLHILDLDAQGLLLEFEIDALGRRATGEINAAEVLGCQFLGSWRFVAALTGNYLTLIDTERGRLNSKLAIDYSLSDDAELEVLSNGSRYMLAVVEDGRRNYYRIATPSR